MADLYDRRVAITVGEFRFVSDPSLTAKPVVLADGRIARGFKVAFKSSDRMRARPTRRRHRSGI